MLNKIAVIGSGISGISISRMLLDEEMDVTIFEKSDKKGGLIKCERINDNLFHKVGGHVFNSKNRKVLDWFWKYFDRDNEFLQAKRNAKVWLNNQYLGYPIENFLFDLPKETVSKIVKDLLNIEGKKGRYQVENFEQFLLNKFGRTLYDLYFEPYNKKVWNCDLSQVPLQWLDGKLPVPDIESILLSNILREEESEMVHSVFFYPKEGGSQFIIDRLSEGIDIKLNSDIKSIAKHSDKWIINGTEQFDAVVYCGDIRELHKICQLSDTDQELNDVKDLRSNGTSTMFCETDFTDISWLYIPEEVYKAHRIVYTGTFSPSNNRGSERITCIVEFAGIQELELMRAEIKKLPGNLRELAYNFEPDSYVVHFQDTKEKINELRKKLEPQNLFLLGRFSEWEYYNMDNAIEKAMEIKNEIIA